MGKKKARTKDKPTPKPKSLRKQLRQAESDLGKAAARRDRAQARVDALSIIADEIRARLAEVERAAAGKDAGDKDAGQEKAPVTAGRKPAAARKPATTTKPAGARKAATGPAKQPATARRTAAAASKSDTATARKRSGGSSAPRTSAS